MLSLKSGPFLPIVTFHISMAILGYFRGMPHASFSIRKPCCSNCRQEAWALFWMWVALSESLTSGTVSGEILRSIGWHMEQKRHQFSLSDPHLTFYLTHGSDILSSILSKNSIWHSLWQVFWHYMHTLHYITLHYIIIITLYYITLHTYIYMLEERKKKRCLNCLPTLTRKGYLSNKFGPIKKGKESQE